MKKKKRGLLNVIEAVDHLSNLADLNETQQQNLNDPEKNQENIETIRGIFRTLTAYVQHLYQKERTQMKSSQVQQGLKAMMQLADEAIDKVGRYTKIFQSTDMIASLVPEFKQLQTFYLTKVVSRVKPNKQLSISSDPSQDLKDEKQALKDLDSVQQDRDYDLFYIYQENGKPFFSSNLLRHMWMVGSFDESLSTSDSLDIIDQIEMISDKDAHLSAQEILKENMNLVEVFYKEAFQYKDQLAMAGLMKTIMALMLAANPRNLIRNTTGKSCIDYFADFSFYLRAGLKADKTQLSPKLKKNCEKLGLSFSYSLFFRSGAYQLVAQFIENFAEKHLESFPKLWELLAAIDSYLRADLRNYPNGPLMQILKTFKTGRGKGFDPLLQNSAPYQIFILTGEQVHVTILHLPCPIHQDFIDRVFIAEEFRSYLQSLSGKKHLYIDLQDRTSWKESQRSVALQELSKEAEFLSAFKIVTLDKSTDFYHQKNDYADLNQASDFCQKCYEQIKNGKEHGFYLPQKIFPLETLQIFIQWIHQHIFKGQEILSKKDRLDFIEILYFFIVFYIIETEKPDVMSFSCKDGVDIGSASRAIFYGLCRRLASSSPWNSEDKSFFVFNLFGPPLMIRHRTMFPHYFQRALSAIECFDEAMNQNREKILTTLVQILPEEKLDQFKISSVA